MVDEFPWEAILLVPATLAGLGALNLIEQEWSKTGNFIGHGRDVNTGEGDLQVEFKDRDHAFAAKTRATAILRKNKVEGKIMVRKGEQGKGKKKGKCKGRFPTGEPNLTKQIKRLL